MSYTDDERKKLYELVCAAIGPMDKLVSYVMSVNDEHGAGSYGMALRHMRAWKERFEGK